MFSADTGWWRNTATQKIARIQLAKTRSRSRCRCGANFAKRGLGRAVALIDSLHLGVFYCDVGREVSRNTTAVSQVEDAVAPQNVSMGASVEQPQALGNAFASQTRAFLKGVCLW